jgi:Zn-dependent M28 family amino/carboxypeptidase
LKYESFIILKVNFINKDRYVIIGNHRDSWTFGSVDPSGGTALLLEIANTLARLKQNSEWKPKRSIIFARYNLINNIKQ